jgi:hypothetical protein
MIDWLRTLRAKKAAPLTGAPQTRRLKSYSSASGYVYQYFYEGHRASVAGEPATEYVFSVSSDRKKYFPVSVFEPAAAIDSWERDHTRDLSAAEQYAIAKMALLQAFDEREKPEQLREPVHIRRADLDLIIETLGLE